MGADIKTLPGVTRTDLAANAQPVPEVIQFIEDILAKAKTGHVQAIAFSYVRATGRPSYGWSGIKNGGNRMFALHSGMLTAITDMGVEIANSSDDVDPDDAHKD